MLCAFSRPLRANIDAVALCALDSRLTPKALLETMVA
jgi:hypothetical protein